MLIERIAKENGLDILVDRIEFSTHGVTFAITEEKPIGGGIRIHRNDGEAILIQPGFRNEIIIK